VGYEGGICSPIAAIARNKALSGCIASTDRSFMHLWTEVVLELAVAVRVDVLEQIVDARFRPIYRPYQKSCEQVATMMVSDVP
jgi:hypothetical protein